MIIQLIYWLLLFIITYAALSVIYLCTLAISSRLFYKQKIKANAAPKYKIAVLVPAYKEDGIILSTANNLTAQQYPSELYDVYIIADSFKPATIVQLRQTTKAQVIEVSFEQSTKTKAINQAFAIIEKPYDIALICDADNMLMPDFLSMINTAFVDGFVAVQGCRVAKNLDSPFAILDACSEGINNNIFRKGANALGLSSSVIGSGMAFDYNRLRQVMSEIKAVGGFDKVMQLKLVEDGSKICYLDKAMIFDEKVENAQAFTQQRKRWVSSQFIYLKKYFAPAFRQLFKGNFSYFNLAVIQNIILPRAIFLLLMPLVAVVAFFISMPLFYAALAIFSLYILTLLIALPPQLINADLGSALLRLPRAVIAMAGTLLHINKADKKFIHTEHTKTEISNTLFNKSDYPPAKNK